MRPEDYVNQGRGESLEGAERGALVELGKELSAHSSITEQAFNLVGVALSSLPEVPIRDLSQSRKITTALLNRLSNDLRSAALLALRGYAAQAATLVASMYEAAYAVATIGADENLANAWIEHDDPTRAFRGVREITREGLAKLGVASPELKAQTTIEYRVYRQLCLAKHVHPLLQKQHGYQVQQGNVLTMNGPDLSEPAIRTAWFALEHAAGLAFVALTTFVVNHVPHERQADLMKQVQAIGVGRKRLEDLAKARWGADDPFPGRW